MLATFLHDVTTTFLSVMDTYIHTYIHTYAHHENRSRIRKLATLAIIIIYRYILGCMLCCKCFKYFHMNLNTYTPNVIFLIQYESKYPPPI